MQWPSTDLTNMTNVDGRQVYMVTYIRSPAQALRFSYGRGEREARVSGKGPWERYRRQAKPVAPNVKRRIALLTSEHTTTINRKDLLGNSRRSPGIILKDFSNIYWMRPRIVWRIIQIEQDVNSLRDLHKSVERSSVRKMKLSTACQLLAHCLHLQMKTQNCFPKAQSQYRH